MRLQSALDDLASTTLRAVVGVWEKLLYFAGLRAEGDYSHWGLSRIYGKVRAQQALKDAHHQVLTQALRTPIQALQKDLQQASEARGVTSSTLLDQLKESGSSILPADPGPAAERHFNSVLFALSALEQHRPDATPQDASPCPPPAPTPRHPDASRPAAEPGTADAVEE